MKKDGGSVLNMRPLQRLQRLPIYLLPLVLSATLLVVCTSLKLAVSSILSDGGPKSQHPSVARVPDEVSLALLHFATTSEVPQQSKEEISVSMKILLDRGQSNFLVFGMWHDSLLWATFNHGGRTVFLEESQEWIDRMREKHPQLETYKVDYDTKLGEAASLLHTSRLLRRSVCRANQPVGKSSCPLALTGHHGLPEELLLVDWDVIMIDGPRSFYTNLSFPGRMSAIFTTSVMARSRTAPGYVDIFVHDVSRPVESEYGKEFLCMHNLVNSVGDLWHFRVHPSSSSDFCPNSSRAS